MTMVGKAFHAGPSQDARSDRGKVRIPSLMPADSNA
jgi:hypothetical protein